MARVTRIDHEEQRDDRQAVLEEALADQLPVGADGDEVDFVDFGGGRGQRCRGGRELDPFHCRPQYLMRGSTTP